MPEKPEGFFDGLKKVGATVFRCTHLAWQREKDSNPHIRSQSPLCYLYTIPLCPEEQKLLYRFYAVCQQFFFFGALFSAGPMGGGQAARRSAEVKYFFSGLYSRANTTTHRMMLGSI